MKWNHLKPGDIVDVIAPASQSPGEKLIAGCDWLRSIGLVPRVPEDLITPEDFFASSLQAQLRHILQALQSDSKAIWCLRGGYGSMRLIPYLKKIKPPREPKLFLGFSDITALHLFFTQQWQWPTMHSRVLSQMSVDLQTPDRIELGDLLLGKGPKTKTFTHLEPLNEAAAQVQTIRAKLTGGNLRILQTSIGTNWELKAKGRILFIEDIGERGYSVDRMLEQMIQSKLLDKGLRAVVIGDFTEGEEKNGKDLSMVAFKRFAHKVRYPVFKGLPCGHGSVNYALPFNTPCELTGGPSGTLDCDLGFN